MAKPNVDPRLLAVFAAVVRAGGVTHAAARLGLHKSVVSRSLARLEGELGTRLLRRSTHHLMLTDVGASVLRHAEQVEDAIERIHEVVASHESEVRGMLRVSCSAAVGHLYVLPTILELNERHPKLEVTLELEERFADLVADNLDVVLRLSKLSDSNLVAVKLANNPRTVVAAPSYLEAHGTPTEIEQLRDHSCLLYCNGPRVYDEWEFSGPDGPVSVRVRGLVRVNHGLSLVRAAVAGAGVLMIDRMLLRDELEQGSLVELDFGVAPTLGFPLHALYPAGLVPRKTRVFIDALKQRFATARKARRR